MIGFLLQVKGLYGLSLFGAEGFQAAGHLLQVLFFFHYGVQMLGFGRMHKFFGQGEGIFVTGAAQVHQAVVAGQLVEPGLEMGHLVFSKFQGQFFEYGHYAVFGLFWFFEVFEANPVDQIHISLI